MKLRSGNSVPHALRVSQDLSMTLTSEPDKEWKDQISKQQWLNRFSLAL